MIKQHVSSLEPVQIEEWETRVFRGITLSDADRKLAAALSGRDGRLDVDELRDGIRLTARQWVGVIRFERLEVRIVPKLAGAHKGLVELLAFTSGIDAIRRKPGAGCVDVEGLDLFDLVAMLFADTCSPLVRAGLLSGYVEREEELPIVRGRLLIEPQVRRQMGRLDRLHCRFDELETNIPENRLLLAALRVCTRWVGAAGLRARMRRLQAAFEEVCEPDGSELELLRHGLTYDRLNTHYRDAHALAAFVLQQQGIENLLSTGPTRCFAFLIDMNRLFERFVRQFVKKLLEGVPLRVDYQYSDQSILWNASTNKPYARVIPDLLLECPGQPGRLVIDAKYKRYDEHKVSSADLYQTFLYAYAFGTREEGFPEAILLYPSSSNSPARQQIQVRRSLASRGAAIHVLSLPIPEVLRELRHPAGGAVTRVLRDTLLRLLSPRAGAEPLPGSS